MGNSFTVSTKTKKNPAKILNLTWGNIIRKYVVDDLLPINLDASSIDLPIFSIPESKELFDRAISLIVKAKDKPSNVVDSERVVKRSKYNKKNSTPKAITTPGIAYPMFTIFL